MISPKGNVVLWLEGDNALREEVATAFRERGLDIIEAADEKSAIDLYHSMSNTLDAMVIDMHPPTDTGLALARLNFEYLIIPTVAYTSVADGKFALKLLEYGVQDYVMRSHNHGVLVNIVQNAIARSRYLFDKEKRMEYAGNIDSISIESKMAELGRSLFWIRQKVYGPMSEKETGHYLNYVNELLLNAHEHGNLKLAEPEKVRLLENNTYSAELRTREERSTARIDIAISVLDSEVALNITDEGDGFDFEKYINMSEETILERLELPCGRGINISTKFFDSVEYTKNGASVTLVKKIS